MFCVAATVGVGYWAAEGIVGVGVGYGRDRDIHYIHPVARDRKRFVRRVWDGLAGGDERRRNEAFAFRHVAANIGCPRT